MLANEWESEELEEWGIDVWKAPVEVDYSILDEEDVLALCHMPAVATAP